MRTHTILTKAASVAVCFGILLSGPASAFGGSKSGTTRDVELSADGTLYGQVYTSEGQAIGNAVVELRYNGTAIAKTTTATDGQFVITGVRGGGHELAVGSMTSPVRLWKNGTAPEGAVSGVVVAASEHVVRGQSGEYCPPMQPVPSTSGFGLIDVVTLGMLATSVTALVYAIDTNDELKDLKAQLPASP